MPRWLHEPIWLRIFREGEGEGGAGGAGSGGEGSAAGDSSGAGGTPGAGNGSDAGGAPAGDRGGAPAAAAFDWGKWADSLSDPDKKAYAKGFKSPEALLDGAHNLRKEISNRIKVPGKDASDEDVAAFRKAIGAREKPEEYKVATPDGYEMGEVQTALAGSMQQAAAEAGVPAAAFEAFTKRYFEFEQKVQERVTQEVADFQRTSTEQIKKEFGADFEKHVRTAENFVNQTLNVPEFTELLNEPIQFKGVTIKLQSHPAVVKALAAIGSRTAEDGVIGHTTAAEAETIKSQIRDLEDKWPIGQRSREQDRQIQALYSKLYG